MLFALTIFGLAVVFDPLGSTRFNEQESSLETLRHRKLTRLWLRRLQWIFCWMRRDKHGDDAFFHMASKHNIIIIIIIIITRNKYENLFEKSQFWGPNHRREDNIKIGLMNIVCVCV